MFIITELINYDDSRQSEIAVVYVTDDIEDAKQKIYDIKNYYDNTDWSDSSYNFEVFDHNITSANSPFIYVSVRDDGEEADIIYEVQTQELRKPINLERLGNV